MSRTLIQRLIIAVVALCAAFAVVKVTLLSRTAKAKGPEIKTAKVERGDVVSSVAATGTLEALTTVDVKSNVGGRVDQLKVEVGDRVTKGQLLAEIDPTDTNTQFDQAQADYDATMARLRQADINLQLQKEQSQAQIEQAKKQLESAKAKELQALQQKDMQPSLTKAAVQQAQANLKAAKDDLNQLRIATIPQSKAQAQANYDQAMANLQNAQKNRDRQKALLLKGFVPASTVDSAEQDFETTQAAVHSAKIKLDTVNQQFDAEEESAKARVAQSQAALDSALSNRMQIDIKKQDWRAAQAARAQADAELRLAFDNQKQIDVKFNDITASKAQLVRSKATLDQARTQKGYTTILAPRAGIVLQKYIEQGTIIASGRSSVVQGTNIIQLGDISRMFITCKVDETDIGSIEAGQTVDIKVDAYPNELFEGKVTRVDPQATVEQNVTTIPVKVEVQDPDIRLKPGMNADCEFITAKRENVIVVPNQALRDNEGSYEVTVIQGGKQVNRTVEAGIAGPETTEIRSGLKEGETIVTEIIQPEEATSAPQQPSSPFNPLQRFGGPRGGGGGGGRAGGGGGGGAGGAGGGRGR
jgi:HlyD family secretion protein